MRGRERERDRGREGMGERGGGDAGDGDVGGEVDVGAPGVHASREGGAADEPGVDVQVAVTCVAVSGSGVPGFRFRVLGARLSPVVARPYASVYAVVMSPMATDRRLGVGAASVADKACPVTCEKGRRC